MSNKLIIPKSTPIGGGAHRHTINNTNKHFKYIDGLRGLAILMVVIFHLFIFKVSAGVDIFLFISGIFLLKTHMAYNKHDNGLGFVQAIIRILRRLTPTLVTVVFITTAIFTIVYPPAEWWNLFRDSTSSLLYTINWTLAHNNEYYTSIGNNPSAFQHLWSMSVQLQIFIAVIVLAYFVGFFFNSRNRTDKKYENFMYVLIGLATITSFIYSIYLHNVDQTLNYYSTLSRFWEIGLGMMVSAILLKDIIFVPLLRIIISTIGFVMIAITGIFLNGAEQFPGPLTLIPIIGALLVILSGKTKAGEKRTFSTLGLIKILETKPLLYVGKISYPLYAWHWCLAILAEELYPDSNIYNRGLIVFVISMIVSHFTYYIVTSALQQKEKPHYDSVFNIDYMYRNFTRSKLYTKVGAACIVFMWLFSVTSLPNFNYYNDYQAARAEKASEEYGGFFNAYPGARAIINSVDVPDNVGIEPNPNSDVFSMMPSTWYDDCYTASGEDTMKFINNNGDPCYYGDVSSQETLYVIGGSHSEQYITALDQIGKKRNVRVIPIIKMGCPLVNEGKWDHSDFSDCDRWSESALKWIIDNPPTMGVFITSTRPTSILGIGPDRVPDSYVELFKKISDAGIYIYAVRDNPWIMARDENTHELVDYQLNAKTCISSGGSPEDCGTIQSDALAEVNPAIDAYSEVENIQHIDFTPLFCQNGYCPAVIGNVLVYRDSNHLTDIFINSMEPFLESAIFNNGWDASKVEEITDQIGSEELNTDERELPEWAENVTPEDLGTSNPYIDPNEIPQPNMDNLQSPNIPQ